MCSRSKTYEIPSRWTSQIRYQYQMILCVYISYIVSLSFSSVNFLADVVLPPPPSPPISLTHTHSFLFRNKISMEIGFGLPSLSNNPMWILSFYVLARILSNTEALAAHIKTTANE